MTRRSLVDALDALDDITKPGAQNEETIIEKLCKAIAKEDLIPVIGDTIRISHMLDVDMDQDIGVDDTPNDVEKDIEADILAKLNIIEEIAYLWAKDVEYPLKDRHQLPRVALFCSINDNDPVEAKENYLAFLKKILLGTAFKLAKKENDDEGLELVTKLFPKNELSFTDIAKELDFPRFPNGKVDPLRILARLPIKIYITTSYFDFIEQALIAEDKKPQSRLCLWNLDAVTLEPIHQPERSYQPNVNQPVVYHLLGMEQYPTSLVLSEDDYLNFLWKLASDSRSDDGNNIIPPYLEGQLKNSSLLLLGYRLEDWDFRVLLRGLLNANQDAVRNRRLSVAMQLDPAEQPLVLEESQDEAKEYLEKYFDKSKFRVEWGDSDQFITDLWQAFQQMNSGDDV